MVVSSLSVCLSLCPSLSSYELHVSPQVGFGCACACVCVSRDCVRIEKGLSVLLFDAAGAVAAVAALACVALCMNPDEDRRLRSNISSRFRGVRRREGAAAEC